MLRRGKHDLPAGHQQGMFQHDHLLVKSHRAGVMLL
jgi:hypothetical protein